MNEQIQMTIGKLANQSCDTPAGLDKAQEMAREEVYQSIDRLSFKQSLLKIKFLNIRQYRPAQIVRMTYSSLLLNVSIENGQASYLVYGWESVFDQAQKLQFIMEWLSWEPGTMTPGGKMNSIAKACHNHALHRFYKKRGFSVSERVQNML